MAKNNNKFPKNVGIIMDGNGRWALKNSLQVSQGHKKGVDTVREIVEVSVEKKIKSLTLYAFSSENWQRPKSEINAIKNLVIDAINDQVPELKEQRVQLEFFGHLEEFGNKVINKIKFAESETNFEDPKLNLNIALSYGGQQDILDIVKGIAADVLDKKINLKDIDQKIISEFSCAPVESIDLLIRTGGDKRVSNFLLYQIAYAEIMFIDKFWPDFKKTDFIECLDNFKKVSRRFGKRL